MNYCLANFHATNRKICGIAPASPNPGSIPRSCIIDHDHDVVAEHLGSTLLPIAMSVSLFTESSKLLLLVDQTCVQPHHAPPKYVPGMAAHRGSSPSPRHPRIEHNANSGLLLGVSEYTSLGSPHAKLGGVARLSDPGGEASSVSRC